MGRVAIAVAGVAAVSGVVAAAYGLTPNAGTTPEKAGSTTPGATAQVAKQTLLDTESADGELGYGDTTNVASRIPGTVTALPATGATVKRGQAIFGVDNTPVVLLYGALPAYRALAPGVEGEDVEQFEKNLKALGYTGFEVDEEFSSSTAEAVREWQEDLGLPETGAVELGRVVYAPSAVRVDSHDAAVGDAVQPGAVVLAYTGTARVVTVELEVSDQRLAKKGATVSVTLPDGKAVPGKVTDVATIVQAAENPQDEAQTKIEVTVAVDAKALAGLDEASVEVAFTAAKREGVLTVPVAALLALAEGGYGVQVVEGGTTRIIAVTTGLFANGQVEVSGADLAEGMTVGMPS